MIDLHSHILPGIDDGAPDIAMSLDMARAFVADGVMGVACTPHILPGLYLNTGPAIRAAVAALQSALDEEGIPLRLFTGADNHVVPDFVEGLRQGRLLSLADTRYVLVEPPHHVAPPRLEELFFNILVSGYVPILTHPERLTWITAQYALMERLGRGGVWMQITAGSLTGSFGKNAQYWAERMLDEGLVQILASDAHDVRRRPPGMAKGRDAAARRVGDTEAHHLVVTRPRGVLSNISPSELPSPQAAGGNDSGETQRDRRGQGAQSSTRFAEPEGDDAHRGGLRDIAGRLRRIFQ